MATSSPPDTKVAAPSDETTILAPTSLSGYHACTDENDDQLEKKLVRKLDMRLIPWLAILYLMLSLDRNNIGNARLGGLEQDLQLKGNEYYTALTIFFAGKSLLKKGEPQNFY